MTARPRLMPGDVASLVATLRDFGEMPTEGGAADPLIEVMNSLARQAVEQIAEAQSRITRAIAALDAAPDVDPAKATGAQAEAAFAANLAAWQILAPDRDPPSQRGGRVETGEGGDV